MTVKKLLVAAALLGTSSVTADVLVTQDGARIETKGAWQVEGRRVIFTLPNGTLSAVRASEIDLDASRAATEQVHRPAAPPPPPPPPKAPVLVLTNDDLPEVIEGEADSGQAAPQSPSDREPVQVVNWRRSDTGDGIEIRGTLHNTGRSMAANISLSLEVKDEDDEVVGSSNAFVGSGSLLAGRSTTFRAVLNDVPDFVGEPVFQVSSTGVTLGTSSFAPGEQADAGDTSDDGVDGPAGDGLVDSSDDAAVGDGILGAGTDDDSDGPAENEPTDVGYEDDLEDEFEVNEDG